MGSDGGEQSGGARYVFGVKFRLAVDGPGLSVEPERFETRLVRRADQPGDDGWLFFRDNLWRGELGDERAIREEAESALGVPVESVDFRELQTDEAYLDALKAEIAADLDQFNASSVTEVLSKYLGSSIRVQE